MPLEPIGKYERLDVLGHGVSGIVYLAWDRLLRRQVALKVITADPADEVKFLAEARVLDKLRHPNIVEIHSVDLVEGKILLDMELGQGQNLQDILKRDGILPPPLAAKITAGVLSGLAFAHAHNVVHRDIKPANILVDRRAQAKLVDFGLAEILGTNAYAGGAGTYAYMAPEDFESAHSDHRSDLWAVGVCLYEMVAGQRPFSATPVRDPFSWKNVVQTQPHVPLVQVAPECPLALSALLDRVLAKAREERYQSAEEMREDLLRAVPALIEEMHIVLPEKPGWSDRAARPEQPETAETSDWEDEADFTVDGTIPGLPQDAVAQLSRPALQFGKLPESQSRSLPLLIKARRGSEVSGRILEAPNWVTIAPEQWQGRSVRLQVAAPRYPLAPGDYAGAVRLKIDQGQRTLPVSLTVMPARLFLADCAPWLFPLLVFCIFPLLANAGQAGNYLAAGGLALSLSMVCSAARAAWTVQLLPAICTGAGLGVGLALGYLRGWQQLDAAVYVMALLAIQFISIKQWKIWRLVLPAASMTATWLLLHPSG